MSIPDPFSPHMLIIAQRSDIRYWAPFPSLQNSISNHITYLDTTGRPAITLKYQNLVDRHSGMIYVRLHSSGLLF